MSIDVIAITNPALGKVLLRANGEPGFNLRLGAQFLIQLVRFARRVCEAPVRVSLRETPKGDDMAEEDAQGAGHRDE